MNKRSEFPGFGCGDPDCRVCGEGGLGERLGGIVISSSDGFPDIFEEIFRNKGPLDNEQLASFLAGPLADRLRSLLSGVRGMERPPKQSFEENDSLPPFINEAWKAVHRVSNQDLVAPLDIDSEMTMLGIDTRQGLLVDRELKTATATIQGTMPKVTKDVADAAIVELIRKTVLASVARGKTLDEASNFSFSLRIAKGQWDNNQEYIIDTLSDNWPELFSVDNSLSIEKAPEDSPGDTSFVLTLDGKIQKDQVVPEEIGIRVVLRQEANEKLEEEIKKKEQSLQELTQKIKMGDVSIRRDTTLIIEYLEKNPIEGCEPVMMAIDPEDDVPCLIVLTEMDEKLKEIPKGILKKIALSHISGEKVLPEELLEIIGIEEIVADLKKTMDAV